MTRINALSWEFRSVCFLQRLQARKWNNFAIVIVVLIFVLNENIGNFLPVCNAGLLHDLTLGVSHNNYHKYIFIHVVSIIFRFSRGLKFRGLCFQGLSFRGLRSEVWSFKVWVFETPFYPPVIRHSRNKTEKINISILSGCCRPWTLCDHRAF